MLTFNPNYVIKSVKIGSDELIKDVILHDSVQILNTHIKYNLFPINKCMRHTMRRDFVKTYSYLMNQLFLKCYKIMIYNNFLFKQSNDVT